MVFGLLGTLVVFKARYFFRTGGKILYSLEVVNKQIFIAEGWNIYIKRAPKGS